MHDPDHRTMHKRESVSRPGAIVPFAKIAAEEDDTARFVAIAETIHMQMGMLFVCDEAIRSVWAIQGKYREGGNMIRLAPERVRKNGNVFCVSYHHGRDDYTITYGIHKGENIVIIEEHDMIYADMLCSQFTEITGVEIPVVSFA